jgi:iron complex transport system permease protein
VAEALGERGPSVLGLPRLHLSWVLAGVAAVLAASIVGALAGPVRIPMGVVGEALIRPPLIRGISGPNASDLSILWSLRFPRVVLGALVGAMLATAGASYQGVFRNPLADPYLLGSASGAVLGATLAIVFANGGTVLGVSIVPAAAFAGAGVAVGVTYALGSSLTGYRNTTTLILAGVAVAAFLTSIQAYVQQVQSESLRQVYAWILGRLVTAGWDGVGLVAPYAAVSMAILIAHRRLLDAMAVGDEEVSGLGVSPRRVRLVVVAAATLCTAAAVAAGGAIGFVGIIVPHAVRLVFGTSYRVVLPMSMLLGGAFLVLADTAARTLAAPAEVPIGAITAMVGAPFFLVVLRSRAVREL